MRITSFSSRNAGPKRSLEPLAWAALPVLGLAAGVVASGVGIDLLLVAAAGLFLFTLERTIGDWMAEMLGAIQATAVFGLVLFAFTWKIIDSSDSFLAAAEQHGYRSVYYRSASVSAAPIDPHSSSGSAPAPATVPSAAQGRSRSGTSPDQVREREPGKTADVPSSRPAETGVVGDSRILFGRSQNTAAPAPTRVTLSLSSARVASARQIVLSVQVTAEARRVTEGVVEFIVNGAAVGRVSLASGGVATTTFATYIPGMYEIQARFSGTSRYKPSSSELRTLQVLQQ